MAWTLSGFADEAGEESAIQIETTLKAGMKQIDLRGVDGHNIVDLPEAKAAEVKKKMDDAGLTVGMFGSPIGKIDVSDDFAIDQKRLDHLARMRDVFGTNSVRMFSYYFEKRESIQQWGDESIKRLVALREQAAKLDLVLYHENECGIFGDRLPEVQRIVNEVRDGKAFKIIFDFDNFNRSGDDVWANWEALKDVVDAFHLKDSDKAGQHVPIGEGNGKAPEILTDAVKRGRTGPLTLEPHLRHSDAVVATHVGGSENESLKNLSAPDCYLLAAEYAKKLLDKVGATVV